ncbi:hypothetical protein GF366_01910, partial [Candidatus Peregrinibacteria bacterium]|nr:hypothetical protein [Candidatus Peregrinibacteria bacterium]
MKIKKIIKTVFCDFIISIFLLTTVSSFYLNTAKAGNFEPYTKTFSISAYYSPLPCQKKYTTGSYEGDIRLNGSGVNGADGTAVYPGMVAAPKNYPFGTKMYIPGLGTVSVHDRGGAIVEANGEEGVYDRLDVWMGYGDKGLARALTWGKRNVSVTVYGTDPGIKENILLTDYSPDEAIPNACIVNIPETDQSPESTKNLESSVLEEPDVKLASSEPADPVEELNVELAESLETDLKNGDEGDAVKKLQRELTNLNFYRGEINGIYDEITEHAVFKFQQSQLLAGDKNSAGAGVFGPKTRDRMNEIISSKN